MKTRILRLISLLILCSMMIGILASCEIDLGTGDDEEETVKVTFDSDGGSKVKSQKLEVGECAEEPKDPVKDGYEFDGWYLDDELWDFDTEVEEDITLTAKWKKSDDGGNDDGGNDDGGNDDGGNDDGGNDDGGNDDGGNDDGGNDDGGNDDGGNDDTVNAVGEYTFNTYMFPLSPSLNPHTADEYVSDPLYTYVTHPFVIRVPFDTERREYQWAYEMAVSVTDVTESHTEDLIKYGVVLPEGTTPENVSSLYVYEIKLNPDALWQDGSVIDAEDYLYSMEQLLHPQMNNFRAKDFYEGSFAIAGSIDYRFQGRLYKTDNKGATTFDALSINSERQYTDGNGNLFFIGVDYPLDWLGGFSLKEYFEVYGESFFDAEAFNELACMIEDDGTVPLTNETYELLLRVVGKPEWGEDESYAHNYFVRGRQYDDNADFRDTVGLYKEDDYTLIYVCGQAVEFNDFLEHLSYNWLVHEGAYEANKSYYDGYIITDYGTSVSNTMSYSPYKLVNYSSDEQAVFERNASFYGYQENADGELYSLTDFEVDGKRVYQYNATRIVVKNIFDDEAETYFRHGELDYLLVPSEDPSVTNPDILYLEEEAYSMCFFFNTNVDMLSALDHDGINKNSVVLSNQAFRKALSLAINRQDLTATDPSLKPLLGLFGEYYYSHVTPGDTLLYRDTEAGMQAIVDLYGVSYGEGEVYAGLKEAYDSILGYNLTEAKQLMKEACDELVAAGLYEAGEDVVIKIAWKKGSFNKNDKIMLTKLNEYLQAATEGSGFGTITFEGVCEVIDRYNDVPAGRYAVAYGGWGSTGVYPFDALSAYFDPDSVAINEAACWDPKVEMLTLTFVDDQGNTVTDTMTWQQWKNALTEEGKYSTQSNTVKCCIVSKLEAEYLAKYYRIPIATLCIATATSYKIDFITDNYGIGYGFGGIRLAKFNYTDAEWEEYVEDNYGSINYN